MDKHVATPPVDPKQPDPLPLLWHRARRILPGFFVCLLVVAFAPRGAWISGGAWAPIDAVTHVVGSTLVERRYYTVGSTLSSVRFPGSWGGTVWALRFELWAYAGPG